MIANDLEGTVSKAIKKIGVELINSFMGTAFSTVTGVAIDELPNTHMGLR